MSRKTPKSSFTIKLNQPANSNIFSYKHIMPDSQKQKQDKASAQLQLAYNLQVVSSPSYQDLVAKLRILKAEKEPLLQQLRLEKKERRQELKNLFKDKNKVKMDIWDKIGKICKLKEDISVEKDRRQMLDEFFSEGIIPQTNHQDFDHQEEASAARSARTINSVNH